jgi:hypothetical protein
MQVHRNTKLNHNQTLVLFIKPFWTIIQMKGFKLVCFILYPLWNACKKFSEEISIGVENNEIYYILINDFQIIKIFKITLYLFLY